MTAATGDHLLVLGATGRVGRLLHAAWPKAASTLTCFRQTRSATDDTGEEILYWPDLANDRPLRDWADRFGLPRAILMLGGATSGHGEAFAANVELARLALGAAVSIGCPRVLLASSSAVYGRDLGRPFDEADPAAPVNDYGRSKRAIELMAEEWKSRLDVCCMRIGNVLGADAMMASIARWRPGDPPVRIDRFANGHGPHRSYIGPETLAEVIQTLTRAAKPLPFTLNVAAPDAVAMADLARRSAVPWTWQPGSDPGAQTIVLSCRRLGALHSFHPMDSDPGYMLAQLQVSGH